MSLNLGTMFAAVALDPSNFNNKAAALPGTAEAAFKRVQDLATRYLTFDAVFNFGKKSFNNYLEAERTLKSYQAALRNVGQELNANTREAQSFASEMQKITKYGDETTINAMTQGINFGIDPAKIQDAAKAAMVMAEKYTMDLSTAMTLLGKASQGQTETLSRYGIVLDDTLTKEEQFNQLLTLGSTQFGLVTDAALTAEGQLGK